MIYDGYVLSILKLIKLYKSDCIIKNMRSVLVCDKGLVFELLSNLVKSNSRIPLKIIGLNHSSSYQNSITCNCNGMEIRNAVHLKSV